jgi:hypothetical protein
MNDERIYHFQDNGECDFFNQKGQNTEGGNKI